MPNRVWASSNGRSGTDVKAVPTNAIRRILILVTAVLVAMSLVSTPVAVAQSTSRDFASEAGFLSSINSQRAAGGLSPLTLSGPMTTAADGWARQMSQGSFLAHATDIVTGSPVNWTKVGENVGRGQSVNSLTAAFMASPGHRANIMDPSFTHVGIAVYTHPTDGRIYTTHRFAAVPQATIAAPTPTPEPTAAPEPTAEPTVAPTPCLLYTSPSPRDATLSRMPSSA